MGRSRSRGRSRKPALGYVPTNTEEDDHEEFEDEIPSEKKDNSEMEPINGDLEDQENETVECVIQAELNRINSKDGLATMCNDEEHYKLKAKRRSSNSGNMPVDADLMSRYASSTNRHRRSSSRGRDDFDDEDPHHGRHPKYRTNNKMIEDEYQHNMQIRRKMGYSDHPPPHRSHDEFEDEHSEHNGSYNSRQKVEHVMILHESKMNQRKKVFIVAVFFIVLLSLGIVILVNLGTKDDSEGNAIVMRVPEPPSNIDNICSPENVSTNAGKDRCTRICKSGSCCMASAGNSCFFQNEDMCGKYAACGNLNVDTDIVTDDLLNNDNNNQLDLSEPPSNIDSICSPASLKTASGYMACENACEKGQCCFVEDNDRADLSQAYIIKSCQKSNPVLCGKYSACTASADNSPSSEKPHTDTNTNTKTNNEVDEKCSQENLDTGLKGVHECEKICQTRSCCFASSQTRNCVRENKEWCDEYSACNILYASTPSDPNMVVLPPASSQMKTMCKDPSKLTTHDRIQCTQSCQLAKCCLFVDFTCANINACEGYDYCGEFLTSGSKESTNAVEGPKKDPSKMSPLELTCSDLSTVEAQTNCRTMCDNGMCCFDYGPKGCSSEDKCMHYGPCQQLISLGLDFDDNQIDGSDVLMHDVKVMPSELVAQACDIANIVSEQGLGECVDACKEFMCCFDYTANGCAVDQHCPKYASCAILNDKNIVNVDAEGYDVKKDVDIICDIDSMMDPNSKTLCETICEPHRCCFNEECFKPECSQYHACGIVMNEHQSPTTGTGSTGSNPVDDLSLFCDAELINGMDPFYQMQCEDVCREALCCIARDGDCRDRKAYCASYSLCDLVWKDTHGTTVNANVGTTVPVSEPTSTSANVVTIVTPPPTLRPTTAVKKEPQDIPQEIGDPNVDCSVEALMADRTKCLETCAPFKCCWSKKPEENCFDKYEDYCLKYIYCPED